MDLNAPASALNAINAPREPRSRLDVVRIEAWIRSGGTTEQQSTTKSEVILELRHWLERRFGNYKDIKMQRLHAEAMLKEFGAQGHAHPLVSTNNSAAETVAAATAGTMKARKLINEKGQEDMIGLFLAMSLKYLGVKWISLDHVVGDAITDRAHKVDAEVVGALMAVGENCASIEVLRMLVNINSAGEVLESGRKLIDEVAQRQKEKEKEQEQFEESTDDPRPMRAPEPLNKEQGKENRKVMTPEQAAKDQERKKKERQRKEAQKKRKAQAKRSQIRVAVEEVQAVESEEEDNERSV
ncbi:hypothetical protein LTS18_000076 [Coniosporium uncinatum]|uniref:Uncharacterized protein n=1 Tax=Coniosporium uncinatum TaxID=93489 RepID=A0ACC3DDJ6_9PEZI|nr:hypothetical protein LTS18_000076 [Coniosporium uncinatum]